MPPNNSYNLYKIYPPALCFCFLSRTSFCLIHITTNHRCRKAPPATRPSASCSSTRVRTNGQAGADTGPSRGPTADVLGKDSRGLGRAKKRHYEGNIAHGLSGREAGTFHSWASGPQHFTGKLPASLPSCGICGCCYCFAQQPPARRPLASLPHFAGPRPERRGARRPLRLTRRRTAARPAATSLSPNFASSRLYQFSIANRCQSCTIGR